MLPLFAPKQTFARIDYLQQGGRLVGKKALIMLNFLLKSRQKQLLRIYASSKIALITSPMVCPSTLKRVGYWNFSKLILIPNWHLYYRVCVNRKPSFLAGDRGYAHTPPHSIPLFYPCRCFIQRAKNGSSTSKASSFIT